MLSFFTFLGKTSFFERCAGFTRQAVLPAVVFGIAAVATPAANAQLVFDNGNPDNVTAWYSDPTRGLYCAETFTLTSTATFNNVTWYGVYADGAVPTRPDNFTLAVFNTFSGLPDATQGARQTFAIGGGATRTATGAIVQTNTAYRYSVTLPTAVTLDAGTYGLGIINNTTANTARLWSWLTSAQTGTLYQSTTTTGLYAPNPGELAFRLSLVAAPEPESLALIGVGFVGCTFATGIRGTIARRKVRA